MYSALTFSPTEKLPPNKSTKIVISLGNNGMSCGNSLYLLPVKFNGLLIYSLIPTPPSIFENCISYALYINNFSNALLRTTGLI